MDCGFPAAISAIFFAYISSFFALFLHYFWKNKSNQDVVPISASTVQNQRAEDPEHEG